MLMAETAVLVTPPGGVAAMGVFLPPGSAIAVLNYIAVDDNSELISVCVMLASTPTHLALTFSLGHYVDVFRGTPHPYPIHTHPHTHFHAHPHTQPHTHT